jgi:hypothetical protein
LALRRNRKTGFVVGLYESAASGIESDPDLPYMTLCEEHSNLVCHETRRLAASFVAVPWEWCAECETVVTAMAEFATWRASAKLPAPGDVLG